MPRFISSHLRARLLALSTAAGLLTLAALAGPGGAAAAPASVPVQLRVDTSGGQTLADHVQYTRPVDLRTHPRADCFGRGTGGSGERVRIGGLTALGALTQASRHIRKLRPLLITDHDFGFPGLGVCGIGGRTPASEFWMVKTDGAKAAVSADQAGVERRGSVLWHRMPADRCQQEAPFACPSALELRAPARARPGAPFTVRVLAEDDSGDLTPARGARVNGAPLPTGGDGRTSVVLTESGRLRARMASAIDSRTLHVCVNARLIACPPQRGLRIMGSQAGDRIRGTRGSDRIRTGPGNNRVNVRDGVRDLVVCGRGRSLVVADRDDVVKRCRFVRRR